MSKLAAERLEIRAAIKEATLFLMRIDSEKEALDDYIVGLTERYDLEKSDVKAVIQMEYKQDFDEKQKKNLEKFDLYEQIFK